MTDASTASLWQALLGDLVSDASAQGAMARHWELVQQWNARTNLTAIQDTATAIVRHYRDCLMALPHLQAGPIVDFGSGAGYPGLVLAIARPDWQVTLVEPRRKRVSFLEVARARLGLGNVRVRHGRLEDKADQSYAHAVSRATFANDGLLPMHEVQAHVARWLQDSGTLLLYRSQDAAAPAFGGLPPMAEHPYVLPATAFAPDASRAIVIWSAAQMQCSNRTIAPVQVPVV